MREVTRLLVVLLALHSALAATRRIRYGRAQSYERPSDDGQQELTVTVYPHEQDVRDGTDVTFDCRARTEDSGSYPEVRWSRVGGQLPSTAYESSGRLTMNPVRQEDAGSYICTATHGGIQKEAHAQLTVHSFGPQEQQGGQLSISSMCRADERACGNNECVKSDYVCDGEPDCRDKSDEQNCPSLRACEPNEFKCGNGRCVQKMWLCDGDDDCGDGSDEQNCKQKSSNAGCGPTEFRCRDGLQCVLSSFHCDGSNDCRDGSDEVGCVQPTFVEVPETKKQVPEGGTLQLTCRAVAVPEPYINWRLNWGPVCHPPRCLQHSEGGIGTLTINNAQPLDQGAYSCEAINVKGRVLATPDCIVRIVNIPAPSPTYEPQVHCNPAGSAIPQPSYGGQCPCKPQVTGPSCDQCRPGAFHLHDKAPQGCLKCFCFGVTDQCRSSTWYRSKEKLQFNGDPQGVTLSDVDERDIDQNARYEYQIAGMITHTNGHYGGPAKFWRMPQRFLGNKVSSYGGELAFDMQHSCPGPLSSEPLVVIKGNRMTLVHRHRNGGRSPAERTDRITMNTYENEFEHSDGRPASREDLMMVLADLQSFLIRATHCDGQRSTSLGDVSWEIAVDRDTQDKLALEVEQCVCPSGYTGLSCENCAPGYERSGSGPYLGTCVPARAGPQCSAAGAISTQPSYAGTCQCKTYATGPMCDQCPPNSFHMADENPHGCIPCFCSGVTQQCSSSGYSRAVVQLDYAQGARDQLDVTTNDAHAPFQPQSPAQLSGREISFSAFYETPGQTLYWKLPTAFLGNKVTSYGGALKYTFKFSGSGAQNGDPDVILRGNDITLYYKHRTPARSDADNSVEVRLFEDQWHRVDGQQATREHLLMCLADLEEVLIKMSHQDDCSLASLLSVTLEYAQPQHTGMATAHEVEQCMCPPGYVGSSCEDCAPGYSRTGGGLYLGLCERCECHGHAAECDKEHGFCVNCQHNTEGDQCERCMPGFSGDARRGTPHDCQPAATRPPCDCNNHSPRGCDSFGRCLMCEHNTEGYHCEGCKKGYYGEATRGTPYDCTPCPCPGASDCFLDPYGQVQCRICPAGFQGRLCDECAPGYSRSRTPGGRECEPIGQVGDKNVVFVPTPEAPMRVQIDSPKNVHVPHGGRAQWFCRVLGHWGPNVRIEWTKVGMNSLPDSAVASDGSLVINDVRDADAGQYRCTATGPHQFATDDATLVVARPQSHSPVITPASQTVNERENNVRFECSVEGNEEADLHWRKDDGSALGFDVTVGRGVISFSDVQPADGGAYVCYTEQPDGSTIDSAPAYLNINPSALEAPIVESGTETVKEGGTVTFRCTASPDSNAELMWRREDGRPLGSTAVTLSGILTISNAHESDGGAYLCTAQDPEGISIPADSTPAYLTVIRSTPQSVLPIVETPSESVDEGSTVTFVCTVPEDRNSDELHWRREDGESFSYDTTDDGGLLTIVNAQSSDAGIFICFIEDLETGDRTNSEPVTLTVNTISAPSSNSAPSIENPRETVEEGAEVTFRCRQAENGDAQLFWRREDGEELSSSANVVDGHLIISNVHSSDSGAYVCYTEDALSGDRQDSEPAHLDVQQQQQPDAPQGGDVPVVQSQLVSVVEGTTAVLMCTGSNGADLHWRRDDDGYLPWEATDIDGVLTIANVYKSDGGRYVCYKEDPITGQRVEAPATVLQVNEQSAPEEPALPEIDSPTVVREGETITLRCSLRARPNARFTWRREDGRSMGWHVSQDGGVLTFSDVKPTDAGTYVCSAEDPDTGDLTDSEPTDLTVQTVHAPSQSNTPQVDSEMTDAVEEGDTVTLRCNHNDFGNVELHWRRQDGASLGYRASDQHGVLTITNILPEDAGVYICSAEEMESGDRVDSTPVHVTVNPSLSGGAPVVENPNETVEEGGTVRFRCNVPNAAGAEVHWKRQDGSPLGYGVSEEQGILVIAQAQPSDSGAYICTSETPRGDQLDSPPAYLAVHPGQPRELGVPSVDLTSPTVNEGESVTIHCQAPSSSAETNWHRQDGASLGYDTTDEYGVLTIPRVQHSDTGVYICTAVDPETGETSDSAPVHVRIANAHGGSSSGSRLPQVDTASRSVEEGETVTFRCTMPGDSDARMHWRRQDGAPLAYGVTDTDGILTIPRAEPADVGAYICIVDDRLGGAPQHSQPVYLSVNLAPLKSPEVDLPEQTIPVGHTATFRCTVPGDPDAELAWRRGDGEPLRDDIRDDEGILTIVDARLSDTGAYICSVDDEEGQIDAPVVYLTVNLGSEPEQPRVNTEREVVDEGGSVTLRCEMPISRDTVLQWRRQDGAAFGQSVVEDTTGTLTIRRVQQSDAGAYICSAEPRYGGEEPRVDSPVVYVIVNAVDAPSPKTPVVDASSEEINEGAPVRFRCYVLEIPDAQLEWRRVDGHPINEAAEEDRGILTIMQTKANDAGDYICVIKNADGNVASESSPLHFNVVPAPPRAPVLMSTEETVEVGQYVRLRCYLPGSQDAKLEWSRKDGAAMSKDATDEFGVLTIMQAKPSDAGAYICTAFESVGGQPLVSKPAMIVVNGGEIEPSGGGGEGETHVPTIEETSPTVVENQAIRLQCRVGEGSDSELSWRRQDGSAMPSSSNQQRGVLTIMRAESSDAGSYICSYGDPNDVDVVDSEPVYLTVSVEQPSEPSGGYEEPPARPVETADQTVTVGQPVRLQCYIPGKSDTDLHWKRQDGSALPSEAMEQRGTLTIMRTEESDSGIYLCSTTETDDERSVDSAPVRLTVTAIKPQGPLLVNAEETVSEGDSVRIRCYVPGGDDTQLHWRREDGSSLNHEAIDEHGILTLPQASPSDSGNYICSVEDPQTGQTLDSPPARVTVNAVQLGQPVVEPSSVSVNVGHPARIRCYVPGNPRATLKWYRQDGQELGSAATETQGYLSISRTDLEDSGVYICSAQVSQGGSTVDSAPVQLTVNPLTPAKPVVNPPSQTIDEGSSARFQCYVPGHPEAQLRWEKEDGTSLGVDVTDVNGILTITNAQSTDAGAYVCSATDSHSGQPSHSEPVYLNVNPTSPVNPVVDPPSQMVDEGSPARFRCFVAGDSDAVISWRKEDGGALGYGVTESQGMLSFDSVTPAEAGAYICSAQSSQGGRPVDSSPAYLGVNPRRPSSPVVEPPTQTVAEGDHAKFRCYLPGVPDAHLSWRRQDGSPLGRDVSESRGLLTFPRAQLAEAGAYVCTATDPRGGAPSDSPAAYLNVNPQRPGPAPSLSIDPPEQTVNENDPAEFKCWVPGVLGCELTWHKEFIGGPLPYGVYQNGGILKIPRAQLHAAGNYICTASNKFGIGQSPPARLTVNRLHVPPRVDPPEMTVNDGDPARFRCWVPGDPSARLSWRTRSGEPIPHGSQENEGILNFPRTHQEHENGYVCTATDPEGRNPPMQSPEVRLIIRKPNTPSVDPAVLRVAVGEPVKFHCWLNEQEGGTQLTWRRADGNPLGYGVSEGEDGTLSTHTARTDDDGEYICASIDAESGYAADSAPVRLIVGKSDNERDVPLVDPHEQTVGEDEPAQFTCTMHGEGNEHLTWHKHGGELPHDAHQHNGVLTLPHSRHEDVGNYVCTFNDPHTGHTAESSPARLNVEQPISPHVDPHEQTVNELEPARIRCWVPGNPSAVLSWRKQGGELPSETDQRDGMLTIPRAQLHDSGHYICSAQPPHGGPSVDSLPARVNVHRPESSVYEPPSHAEKPNEAPVVDPPEQTTDVGNPVRFRCYVPNDHSALVRWSFNVPDGPLPPYAQDDRGVLTIMRPDSSHDGEYFCTYETPQGSIHSPPARLHVNKPGDPPRPEASPADQTVQTGEPARFHCDANSDSPATIRWSYQRAGEPLRGDVVEEGDDVIIHSADDATAGEYICTATNEHGSADSNPVRLHVSDNEEPPTARVVPRVWNGKPGDRHQFRCITSGVPPPQVTWTGPDGSQLPEEVNDIGGGILDFSNGRTDLNGDYTCTAVNAVGEASDHGSVNIGPSLTIKTTPPGPRIVLTAGEPLEVRCDAFGEPTPEVEWLHDPGPERGDLPDDFKPVTILDQLITHPSVGLGNAGVYTCKASNTQATVTKDIHIEVVEASRVATVAVLGGSTQWLEPGSPAELVCAATGNALVDNLQWVKVNDELPPDVEDHNEPGILHFANFKSSDSGVYECRGFRNEEQIATARVTVHATNGGPLGAARVEVDEPSVRVVNQGDSIVLKCSVHGGDSNGVNYEWALLRGGSVVRQLAHEETLTIKRADASNDYGVYRCEAEDDDGQLLGAAFTAVTISHGGQNNAQVVKFDEKADAVITCPVYAVPGAEVTWEKQDGELPQGAVTSRNKLIIKEFDDAATGTYVCKVSVEGQEIEGFTNALIYVPDTIIQVLLEASSESVALGDRAWFDCKVAGDPEAVITWSREGDEDLPDNAQVTGNRLLFTNVREDNGGIYKCHAQTKEGPLETRTVLNVGGAKRKRKHLHRGSSNGRSLSYRKHRDLPKKKRHHSVFGTWFNSL